MPFSVLPKKGQGNTTVARREADPEFRSLRRWHSVMESAIKALEAYGLDCVKKAGGRQASTRTGAMTLLQRFGSALPSQSFSPCR